METLTKPYSVIIEDILKGYAELPYAIGDVDCKTIFDRQNDRYLLISEGWNGSNRVHFVLVHLEIINGKIWVQQDNTERGIANELVEAGIPNLQVVLGFRSPELRAYSGFATA